MKAPTFGSDPEIFVVNANGGIACPVEMLPRPKEVLNLGPEGGVNRDGIAFELNPAPSSDPAVVAANMAKLLQIGVGRLSDAGLHIVQSLSATIDDDMPPDAYEFGCNPDYNAYTKEEYRCKLNPRKYLKRFAGGHISMGIDIPMTFDQVCELVKLFDFYAGLRALFYIPRDEVENAVERRLSYGAAGCFRHKNHLVEYRTPDSSWLWATGAYEEICSGMFLAFEAFMSGKRIAKPKTLRVAINNCDLHLARVLIQSQEVICPP
jgi:hypothetical protein